MFCVFPTLLRHRSIEPSRLLETRKGDKTVDGKFEGIGQASADSFTNVRIAGRGDIPTVATAAILNLTIVFPPAPGFATIAPCTATPPTASTINCGPGAVVANGVTAKVDANGDVCIYTLAPTDILIDANGYLAG